MLTFKRKLKLTTEQTNRVNSWIGACRVVYNLGLEIRISAYKNTGVSVHKYELMKQLAEVKKDVDWIKDVPAQSLQDSIDRLDKSYKLFFKGGGFPKFKGKRFYNSILLKKVSVKNSVVVLPKIGELKMVKDTPIYGKPKTATIVKEPTGYFICITCDANKNIQNKDENQVVGLDVGVSFFCVNSKGEFVNNPKLFKQYESRLRIEGRSLSRKKKNSHSWIKQCKKLARLHHKIANVRKDFLHKESTKIAKQFHTVFVEDLKIKNMTKKAAPKMDEAGNYVKNNASAKSGLNRSILDCGWGMFRTMLEYKTNVVRVNPKYTSQTCNKCGSVDSKNRISQSKFKCLICGHEENADFNSALNIEGLGRAIVRQREALACA